MVRDSLVNLVLRLKECGFDPYQVAEDAWEARCPGHRSTDHALAISRNATGHVELECRSAQKCGPARIIRALGWTNEHVYGETEEWSIARFKRIPVRPALVEIASANLSPEADGLAPAPRTNEKETIGESQPPCEPGCDDSPGGASLIREDSPASPAEPVPADAVTNMAAASHDLAIPCETPPAHTAGADAALEQGLAGSLAVRLRESSSGGETGRGIERPGAVGASAVGVLARLAASAKISRSADGRFCAQVPVGDRLEIYELRSPGFRDWLIDGYLIGHAEPPSHWAVRRVVGMLEARARFSAGVPEVFVRVGSQTSGGGGSPYFLDLGDPSGRAVAISEEGWSVVDRPGVPFRRPEGVLPMPMPTGDGSIDLLRSFVNLAEPEFRLLLAWLTAALRPVGPYPVLVLNGEQASGKSTLARLVRWLVDPQACPVLALPSSTRDLMATALSGWLLVYENITTIPGWFSDAVCQLAFGGGFASRALFTDAERSVIYAQRPVMLIGIDDFVARGDLRDRSVFLHLPAIPRTARQTERAFWPAFRADYPRILGGVLSTIVGGLRELPSVELKELPRMADFAEWGEAIGRAQGWGAGALLSIYDANRKEATEPQLDASPVAAIMLAIGRAGVQWSGTSARLYESLVKNAGRDLGPGWPKSINRFATELRRIAPQLRLHGLSIGFERRRGERIITLHADHPAASQPSSDCQP